MTALLDKLAPEVASRGDGFDKLRQVAQKVLMQNGFPHRKTEAWKYTPLAALEKRGFKSANPTNDWPEADAPDCAEGLIHLHDGRLEPARCRLPDGVTLTGLVPSEVEIDSLDAQSPADAFAWLNLARLEQGWKIRIDAALHKPLALVHTFSPGLEAAVHPLLHIELAESASATLLERQSGGDAGLCNSWLEIDVAPGARMLHLVARDSGSTALIGRTRACVHNQAEYRHFVVDGGGTLTRQDLLVELVDADARTGIHGSAVLGGRALVDYHSAIHHRVGPSESAEDFRILADDRATGVFNGRILIVPGADGSDSRMNTGNLLLSENARVNIKPELEIHAEEVSASHGATVGRLDDMAMFYLRSRGLTEAQANALLKYGFAAAALDGLPDDPASAWLVGKLQQYIGDVE